MAFSGALRRLMGSVGCTAGELSGACGISPSSLSRYLTGSRTPRRGSDVPQRLAAGLAALAAQRGVEGFDEQAAVAQLAAETGAATAPDEFAEALNRVTSAFGVANNQLARFMGFDPSYISRIIGGTRTPADTAAFSADVAAYVARNHCDEEGRATVAELAGVPVGQLRGPGDIAVAIEGVLMAGDAGARMIAVDGFLGQLDDFDLAAFLEDARFDEMKVPSAPFHLPTRKVYEGIEQMKQAELDFLKAAVLSRSREDVIMYSDMPLSEMAADAEFPKKVMMGIALLVRKGLHMSVVHDVHRPLPELLMGLQGWIPVYMAGSISPYYLPQAGNDAFMHFVRSAGSVAVLGEAVAGHQDEGRYTLYKNAAGVAYARRRAEALLSLASPLLRVFRADQEGALRRALRRLDAEANSMGAEAITMGEDTFKNLRITVRPGVYALIEKGIDARLSFLIEYPALVDALARFEPALL